MFLKIVLICVVAAVSNCSTSFTTAEKLDAAKHLNNSLQNQDRLPKAEDFLIVPGSGVGKLEIGDSKEEAVRKLGVQEFYEFRSGQTECPETSLEWGDSRQVGEKRRNGIRAYLKDSKIFMIKVDSFLYRTSEGYTSDSPFDEIFETFPNSGEYTLVNSSRDLISSHDLRYLVDQQKGIAFEFYFNIERKRWLVGFIYVFPNEDAFLPNGCVIAPMSWREGKFFRR